MWGSRRFNTRDDSRNNWWVALLTGGEGWHNNHHAHPVSARHGLAWYEFDLNYYGIWIMGQLGLAKKINALTIAQTTIDSRRALSNAATSSVKPLMGVFRILRAAKFGFAYPRLKVAVTFYPNFFGQLNALLSSAGGASGALLRGPVCYGSKVVHQQSKNGRCIE